MKGQLPIIIAAIIVGALMVSTLYYSTSRIVVINTNLYGYTLNEWILIDEELDTLMFIALKNASRAADQVFNKTFYSTYKEVYEDYVQDYYYDFYGSYNNFVAALDIAAQKASQVLENATRSTINKWIRLKETGGYAVSILNLRAYYKIKLYMEGHFSCGWAREGINMVIGILSPNGDYRVYNKSIEAGIIVKFLYGMPYGLDSIYFPFYIYAYIEQNGIKYYYMIPIDALDVRMTSNIFYRLESFEYYANGNITTLHPIKIFYYGAGESKAMYYHNITDGYDFAWNDFLYGLIDPDHDRRWEHPEGKFLWATLVGVNLNGIMIHTGLKIVLKYRIEIVWDPQHGWVTVLWIGIQGDESMPIPY